ncbi:hypothetical protein TNIN_344631 [Trichonephila inaurata madagascariensis]|uniref:Secreted protein n=1 Tax=Trichonephila inaurata madagascariensis TaxID=2747483 RepID=A0A8X6X7Y6_9ARAC|nr:hypothetical protein TNIN_344631 [Trichonephila inaurata madagascariensis]
MAAAAASCCFATWLVGVSSASSSEMSTVTPLPLTSPEKSHFWQDGKKYQKRKEQSNKQNKKGKASRRKWGEITWRSVADLTLRIFHFLNDLAGYW